MSRLTHFCMGASIALLLTVGSLWIPGQVWAAPDGPGDREYGRNDGHGQVCTAIHKIAAGENLTGIAASYEVSVEALVEENGLDDANLIVEGQSLCIPARNGNNNSYGVSEWGSYGVPPGQSYDPSLLKKQEDHRSEPNGSEARNEEQNEYGESGPYMIPGKSYDPSTWANLESYSNSDGANRTYENDTYQNDTYGRPESSWGVPGKSYDPSLIKEKKDNRHEPNFPEYVPSVTEEEVEEPEEPEEPEVPNGENGENGENGVENGG